MQDDTKEWNPGRADFWVQFYDDEDGHLREKEQQHKKSRELAEGGSLMDHYEWFMEYPLYEKKLLAFLPQVPTARTTEKPMRWLHVGCGNSDFCDQVEGLLSDQLSVSASPPAEVLNVDICENIITHLARRFPWRLYAVGNCCDLHVTARSASLSQERPAGEEPWFVLDNTLHVQMVRQSAVDVVFDKGTADALLSAFAGEFNPNMEAYVGEMLKVLRPGGAMFVISINSEEVVNPYFLSAQDGDKSFQLVFTDVVELGAGGLRHLRVETLGSRYSCYGYTVVLPAD
ncbi:hypothetical protein ABB37_00754 [Leptomonas pyrrhocoris]|uniref:Methyltransferase type 11 domain-containing protein n=1 Tax=Leptomonas pyrrhocoris TaxID=157538 RepID=A0A0M9GB08_LEPPY|nr:hypothetical protein ABB37_00754 [Leptomonas pyrrhocoris]KPA86650.1 hypothetical protein ABB37_00754 [Leptomonas pyrrhocoris]|eukprot:XP_015665089.1 hypothetical protein ABB37_00754 [Leptomonas pyrrhocoris]